MLAELRAAVAGATTDSVEVAPVPIGGRVHGVAPRIVDFFPSGVPCVGAHGMGKASSGTMAVSCFVRPRRK
jgi:hypothetical protein